MKGFGSSARRPFWSYAALFFLTACGGSSLLYVGPPVARYDHNRTRRMFVVSQDQAMAAAAPAVAPPAASPPAAVPPAASPPGAVPPAVAPATFVPPATAPPGAIPPATAPPAATPSESTPAASPPPAAAQVPAAPEPSPILFVTENYAPQSREPFIVNQVAKDEASDGLPPAILVPIYPGLPLPLSSSPVQNCSMCLSDKDDLVDYLATGRAAFFGVQAPDTQGDIKATTACYSKLLAVLSQKDIGQLQAGPLKKTLGSVADEWSDDVVESRYAQAAVEGTLAFRHKDFWFVLYRYPGQPGYTRLVVLPSAFQQEYQKKQPLGSMCKGGPS
jgi:hypothetical protein